MIQNIIQIKLYIKIEQTQETEKQNIIKGGEGGREGGKADYRYKPLYKE